MPLDRRRRSMAISEIESTDRFGIYHNEINGLKIRYFNTTQLYRFFSVLDPFGVDPCQIGRVSRPDRPGNDARHLMGMEWAHTRGDRVEQRCTGLGN